MVSVFYQDGYRHINGHEAGHMKPWKSQAKRYGMGHRFCMLVLCLLVWIWDRQGINHSFVACFFLIV